VAELRAARAAAEAARLAEAAAAEELVKARPGLAAVPVQQWVFK